MKKLSIILQFFIGFGLSVYSLRLALNYDMQEWQCMTCLAMGGLLMFGAVFRHWWAWGRS